MDDHGYEFIKEYEQDFIEELRAEYEERGKLENCEGYRKAKDLCRVLNILAPYAGYDRITPKDLVE